MHLQVLESCIGKIHIMVKYENLLGWYAVADSRRMKLKNYNKYTKADRYGLVVW